jgi:peptidyl-tRNA hydrolase
MPPRDMVIDFVLSSFDDGERESVRTMVRRAADAVIDLATIGIDRAMNRCNTHA